MLSITGIVDALQNYIELFKSIVVLVPVAWVIFVFTEWLLMRQHYSICGIERFFRPNYKIALNPRYIVSLFVATIAWGILYVIHVIVFKNVSTTKIVIFVVVIAVFLAFYGWQALSRKDAVKQLEQGGKSDESNSDNNDKIEKWSKVVVRLRVLRATSLSIVLLLLVELLWRKYFGGTVSNLLLFFFLCLIWHWQLYVNYTIHHREQLKSGRPSIAFRKLYLIDFDGKTYALLTHPNCDSNQVSVSVRAIIVSSKSEDNKGGNTVKTAYLLPAEIKTLNALYTGEIYVADIDFTKILKDSTISNKTEDRTVAERVIELINAVDKDSPYKILKNREWVNLKDFLSDNLMENSSIIPKRALEEIGTDFFNNSGEKEKSKETGSKQNNKSAGHRKGK